MVSLDNLQICGIRSFSPAEDGVQTISFNEGPVTFLVGTNGSGKTTILEAIKYALTGDLPAGTVKGQGFIHDPNLLKMNVVKAFVKLTLVDLKGDMYMVSRVVQLMRKGVALSFTSLDSAISIVRADGSKQKISGRCADIDKNCTEILKISPSILNNVLFCHQENSSWPLEEGKRVKEKFDEIFDTQKYTKVIKIYLEQIKEHTDKYKKLVWEMDYLKSVKEDANRTRENLLDKKARLTSIEEEIELKKGLIKPKKEQLNSILELENKIGDLEKQLASTETQSKGIREQIETLKNQIITLHEGFDEELENEIESFEKKQTEKERRIRTLENRKNDLEENQAEVDGNIRRIQMKLGQLKEEKRQLVTKCEHQTELFKEAKMSLNISDDLSWNSTDKCRFSLERLKAKLREIDSNFDKLSSEKQLEEKKAQEKVDTLRETLARSKGNSTTLTDNIFRTEKRMIKISNEIQELEVTSNSLREVGRKIENLNIELSKIQDKQNETSTNSKIAELKKQITEMERKLEEYEKLNKIAQKNYIIEEKINNENQTKIRKQTEIQKILNQHSEEFKTVFGDNLPRDNLKRILQRNMSSNEDTIKEINKKITSKQKEITQTETQIEHLKRDINIQEKELDDKSSKINSVCQGENFSELQKKTFETREKLQKRKGELRSAKIMYNKFIEMFEKEKPCCPICDTDFTEKRDIVKEIASKLKRKIENIPASLEDLEKNLDNEEKLYNKLHQLETVNNDVEMISNAKLPFLQEQLEENRKKLESLTQDLAKIQNNLKEPTKMLEICKNIISNATLLDQYNSDIKVCEDKINELKSQTTQIDSTMSRTEIEMEISTLKSDINENRNKCDSLRHKIDQQKSACEELIRKKTALLELQMKYQSKMSNKDNLESQLSELKNEIILLKANKENQEDEIDQLEREFSSLLKEKKKLVQDNEVIINTARIKNNEKHILINELSKVVEEIEAYRNRNIEASFKETQNQLEELENNKKELSEDKEKLLNEIAEAKEYINRQQINLRNLRDNLTLRSKQKLDSSLILKISKLKEKIGEYDNHSIIRNKEELVRDITSHEKSINNLNGQRDELKLTIQDVEMNLSIPKNRDANKNYLEKKYEVEVENAVVNDLKVYAQVLHNSILEFHRETMVGINIRLKELWREIYRGHDIDYIKINADEPKNNKGKQAYDYKVVQVKNDIEIEMRGRCSAGQRVLACFIIRLALAELFSSHCGILALDEPLINLDKSNVESVTLAIANIIKSRSATRNFQLIVISHDEEFMRILKRETGVTSSYWLVRKSPEGFSVVTKEAY